MARRQVRLVRGYGWTAPLERGDGKTLREDNPFGESVPKDATGERPLVRVQPLAKRTDIPTGCDRKRPYPTHSDFQRDVAWLHMHGLLDARCRFSAVPSCRPRDLGHKEISACVDRLAALQSVIDRDPRVVEANWVAVIDGNTFRASDVCQALCRSLNPSPTGGRSAR
jgi:hypothetical protein